MDREFASGSAAQQCAVMRQQGQEGMTRTQRERKRCKTGNMRCSKCCASPRFRPAICSNTENKFCDQNNLEATREGWFPKELDKQRAGIQTLKCAYTLRLNKNICASSWFSLFVKYYKQAVLGHCRKPCPTLSECTWNDLATDFPCFQELPSLYATNLSFNLNKNVWLYPAWLETYVW